MRVWPPEVMALARAYNAMHEQLCHLGHYCSEHQPALGILAAARGEPNSWVPEDGVMSEEYGIDQVNEHVIPMRVARGWSQPHPAATHVRTVISWPDPPRPNDDWPIYRGPWRPLVMTDDNEERDKIRRLGDV